MSTHGLRSMTRNGSVPKDLFEVMAGATACSLRVFHGLLTWANLNAQPAGFGTSRQLAATQHFGRFRKRSGH